MYTDTYNKFGFEVLENLLTQGELATFLQSISDLDTSRVICGNPEISWDQMSIIKGHLLWSFFSSPKVPYFPTDDCEQ